MIVPELDYLKESSTTKIATGLALMREEFDKTQEEHLIARSRLVVTDKIIDGIFNQADVAIIGMNAQRTSDYPKQEILDELTEQGYEHTTEADATNPAQKVLTIKLK